MVLLWTKSKAMEDSAIGASFFNKGQVCAGDPDVWCGRGDLLSLCWNGAIAGKGIHVAVVHGSGRP